MILADAGNSCRGTVRRTATAVWAFKPDGRGWLTLRRWGLPEFGYADATGYGYHKNITNQAELQNGAEALTYNKDMKGEVTADRAEKAAARRGSFCQCSFRYGILFL